jgi:3-dehydroquinate dehydratase-2
MRILVLHGPNLNLFGRREPHIYGTTTLPEINAKLAQLAKELQVELIVFQSNHEGVLVDKLHEHIDTVDAAIINPAGLTQYGVSLHDAIKAMPFPVVEIHMSNLAAREEWRHHSIISPALKGTVLGLGWRSYTAGLRALAEIVAESRAAKQRGVEAPGRSDEARHTDEDGHTDWT